MLAFVRENGVRVEETVLGARNESAGLSDEAQQRLLPLIEETQRLENELGDLEDQYRRTTFANAPPQARFRIEEINARMETLSEQIEEIEAQRTEDPGASQTRWSQYSLPGGENYRELLLTLPRPAMPEDARIAELDALLNAPDATADMAAFDALSEERAELVEVRAAKLPAAFRSSHFDQPNILAHVRFNERTDPQGKRTLFVEELQSDWGQTLRKNKERLHQEIDTNFQVIVERMKQEGVLKEVCD